MCSCPGFAASEEARPIERLLDAFYECDQDAADAVIKSPLFKFMENDVSRCNCYFDVVGWLDGWKGIEVLPHQFQKVYFLGLF